MESEGTLERRVGSSLDSREFGGFAGVIGGYGVPTVIGRGLNSDEAVPGREDDLFAMLII